MIILNAVIGLKCVIGMYKQVHLAVLKHKVDFLFLADYKTMRIIGQSRPW